MRDGVERGDIRGCSIRFANVYSPDEVYDDHIIPHIIASLKRTGGVTLLENARETQRTFLNNYDSCQAVIDLLMSDRALDGSVYNVGTTEEINIVDLVRRVASFMQICNPKIEFKGSRTADPRRRLLSVEKIRRAVGWKSKVSLDDGLRMCIKKRMERS